MFTQVVVLNNIEPCSHKKINKRKKKTLETKKHDEKGAPGT
jgi:hypothetical protein